MLHINQRFKSTNCIDSIPIIVLFLGSKQQEQMNLQLVKHIKIAANILQQDWPLSCQVVYINLAKGYAVKILMPFWLFTPLPLLVSPF